MIAKIIQCPKCNKHTLIMMINGSSISLICSDCNYKYIMLLSDIKNKRKRRGY